jgi:hypothetical protein
MIVFPPKPLDASQIAVELLAKYASAKAVKGAQ